MGIDITQLKVLAAILAQAVLAKEDEYWWILKFGNTYSKGSKLNKVASDLLGNGLIETGLGEGYIVSRLGYEKLRRMEIEG